MKRWDLLWPCQLSIFYTNAMQSVNSVGKQFRPPRSHSNFPFDDCPFQGSKKQKGFLSQKLNSLHGWSWEMSKKKSAKFCCQKQLLIHLAEAAFLRPWTLFSKLFKKICCTIALENLGTIAAQIEWAIRIQRFQILLSGRYFCSLSGNLSWLH